MSTNKIWTLCIIQNDTHVLLGMKKRGFGAGWWNGFGGKVGEGESIVEAAGRETFEESGIKPKNLKQLGLLYFTFVGNPIIREGHIFSTSEFEGTPVETEEMKPEWFLKDQLLFDQMWPGDRHWWPLALQNKQFEGTFRYTEDNKLIDFELKEV